MNPEELAILQLLINEVRDSTPLMRPHAIASYKGFLEATQTRHQMKRDYGMDCWPGKENPYQEEPAEPQINPAWVQAPSYRYDVPTPSGLARGPFDANLASSSTYGSRGPDVQVARPARESSPLLSGSFRAMTPREERELQANPQLNAVDAGAMAYPTSAGSGNF